MQIGNELAAKYKTVEEGLSNCVKELEESRNAAKKLRFEVRKAELNLCDSENEDLNNAKKLNSLQRSLNHLKREKDGLEKAIKAQELESGVVDLFLKQQGFWESLESHLKEKQEEASEYMAGLSTPLVPERVIETFRVSIQGNTFSQEAVDIRGIKIKYEQAIKDICKKKIEGTFVSSLELQKPKYLLDQFLFKPHIERIWNIQ